MTEQEKKPLITGQGIYTGKELTGQGNKNGKDWKRYKVYFKPSLESDKKFSFTRFEKLYLTNTKQLSDLVEGTAYKISYNEEERTNNNVNPPATYMSKTMAGIHTPEEQTPQPAAPAPMTATNNPIANATHNPAPQGQTQVPANEFDEFKTKYFAALKKNEIAPNAVHMLGSYLATVDKNKTAPIIEQCKKAIAELETQSQVEQEPVV